MIPVTDIGEADDDEDGLEEDSTDELDVEEDELDDDEDGLEEDSTDELDVEENELDDDEDGLEEDSTDGLDIEEDDEILFAHAVSINAKAAKTAILGFLNK
jgi:hypothetical protein